MESDIIFCLQDLIVIRDGLDILLPMVQSAASISRELKHLRFGVS